MVEVTYLEYNDSSQNTHKFYEVTWDQCTVTIRFGRINYQGTQQQKSYGTAAQARSEAQKRIRDKVRHGYQLISAPSSTASTPNSTSSPTSSPTPVSTTPVSITSAPQPPIATPSNITPTIAPPNLQEADQVAPTLWQFKSPFSTFALAIDREQCWFGNEKGTIYKLDHQGQILQQYQLPNAVKCIVTDDIWTYASCDNGNVYDLTGKFPYLAYEVEWNLDIFWLDIYDGFLGISDANGGLTKLDPDGEVLWNRLSPGKMGWMLCCDVQGFYQGHSKGVTAYEFESGRQLWHQETIGKVLFGCQSADRLYVATSGKQVQCFSKAGDRLQHYACGSSVYACTLDDAEQRLFAADSSAFIYCFEIGGSLIWKMSTGCGSVLSMRFFQGCLYIVTNQGTIACLDVSQRAMVSAQAGILPTPTIVTATGTESHSVVTTLETTSETPQTQTKGVLLECFRQGQKLRIRAISEGYDSEWMVQFPRNLRREGARYWVEELREAKQGNFYRIYGDIKALESL